MINFFKEEEADYKKDGSDEPVESFLKKIYNETEDVHVRYQNAESRKERLLKLLAEADTALGCREDKEEKKSGEELKKLYHFVKGNLYLRLGRCGEELFESPAKSYERAVELLQEYANPGEEERTEPLCLLIQLSLGKYFRNLGRGGFRSNFYLAINEFQKVRSWIEEESRPNREKIRIWLDAEINIGRAYKDLYEFPMAKLYLIPMIAWLGRKAEEKERRVLKGIGRQGTMWSISESERKHCRKAEEEALKRYRRAEGDFLSLIGARGGSEKVSEAFGEREEETHGTQDAGIYGRLEEEDALYRRFFIDALVQFAIVLRKERKYNEARAICKAVLKLAPENIDAQNNLGVCFRKNSNYGEAKKLFEPLMDGRNRFAKIEYWKCILKEEETRKGSSGVSEEEINRFIKEGGSEVTKKTDSELCLLQGRFLLFRGKVDEACETFRKLYELYPFIVQGTIGLKAYYNMATCLLQQEKYYQVREMLDKILKICPKDRLARIDKGWVLMKMNQYGQARAAYEEIMEIASDITPEGLEKWELTSNPNPGKYERIKMHNNLGECYLHTGDIAKAAVMFQKVLAHIETENIEAERFLAWCHMINGEKHELAGKKTEAQTEYKKAMKRLEEAKKKLKNSGRGKAEDICISVESNLIIAKAAYLRMEEEQAGDGGDDSLRKKYNKYMETRILYYPDNRYSQSACREMAYFIKKKEKEAGETQMLYRSFSHIRLWKREEGYRAFSHFTRSHDFLCLGASSRGRILAQLFLIYGEIGRVKELCRYRPDSAGNKELTLAHYTKISTLRILLADSKPEENASAPKLRLWNSVYMNDPSEGRCFLDLLQKAGEEEAGGGAGKGGTQEMLSHYFPHLKNNNNHLAPANGNVYIASLTSRKDDLPMWLIYADRAKGCSIVFEDDFFDLQGQTAGGAGDLAFTDDDYPLYEVQYFDEKEVLNEERPNTEEREGKESAEERKGARQKDKKEKIREVLKQIWKEIGELKALLDLIKSESEQRRMELTEESENAVLGFVADALNEIRFLFKYSEYNGEAEVRAVKCSYASKIDEQFEIPRMYMEVDREIRMKEVMLGVKVSPEETDEIVSWLYATGKVKKVTKSDRHFK